MKPSIVKKKKEWTPQSNLRIVSGISFFFVIIFTFFLSFNGKNMYDVSKVADAFQFQGIHFFSKERNQSRFFRQRKTIVEVSWKSPQMPLKLSYGRGMKRFSSVSKNDNSKENKTKETSTSFTFETGLFSRPHPAKILTGGEDSSFILPYDVGVFDGVGGWKNVPESDAGKFSQQLAELTAKDILFQRKELNLNQIDVIGALKYALKKNKEIGSCTATILSYNPDDKSITGLNLGDSGALIIRRKKDIERKLGKDLKKKSLTDQDQSKKYETLPGGSKKSGIEKEERKMKISIEDDDALEVAFRSRIQMHDFNTPYQLGTNCTDVPEMGHFYTVNLCPDDIIILATDGMFDNLFDQDILKFLSSLQVHSQDLSAYDIALSLGELTEDKASNPTAITPWLLSKNDFRKKKDKQITKRWSEKFSGVINLNKKMENIFTKFTAQGSSKLQSNGSTELDDNEKKQQVPEIAFLGINGPSSNYGGGKRDDVTIVVCKYYEVIDE